MTQAPDPVDTFELLRARPDDPPNIRMLRLAVIVMSAVLAGGVVAVIARIVYLTTRQPSSIVAFQASPGTAMAAATWAADIPVALPAGSKVRSQSLSGNRLSVHYEAPGGDGILIVDLQTGLPVSHVHLSGTK